MGAHTGRWEKLSRSKLETMIREAALGDVDTYIAERYLIGKIPHIEIAGELETMYGIKMDRSTVSRHWKKIANKTPAG